MKRETLGFLQTKFYSFSTFILKNYSLNITYEEIHLITFDIIIFYFIMIFFILSVIIYLIILTFYVPSLLIITIM